MHIIVSAEVVTITVRSFGAPTGSISTLQHIQNNAARIILQAPRRSHVWPLLRQLHWLPVHHTIDYKLAVITYKIHRSSTPTYLSRHIKLCQSARSLRSSDVPLLDKPTISTEFDYYHYNYIPVEFLSTYSCFIYVYHKHLSIDMHSTSRVHICCVVNCRSREHFVKMLSEFASDDGELVLEFPSTLNSRERYLIHEVWAICM